MSDRRTRSDTAGRAITATLGLGLAAGALTGCGSWGQPAAPATYTAPLASSSPQPAVQVEPSPASATACAKFTSALLGGHPTREAQNGPVLRAALHATAQFSQRLRTAPGAGQQWQAWKSDGVTDLDVKLHRLVGRDAPPAGSPIVAFTVSRTIHARKSSTQRWDVVCATTREGGGWLVESIDLRPHLDPATVATVPTPPAPAGPTSPPRATLMPATAATG